MRRASTLLFIFVFFLTGGFVRQAGAEFYGDSPTGLLQLEKKHPYYLFVPPEYSPEKAWPILFLLGKRGEDPKEVIGPWVDWAKKNRFFLLAVPTLVPENDLPTSADEWLFEVKKDVGERYRIDPDQILIVGSESGGHYAAYLGSRYPDQFSAAVLVREAWPGLFEKLAKPKSNPKKQISFYVAVDPEGEKFSEVEKKALEFEKKGYRITLEPLKADEDFSNRRDRMIQWFHEGVEARSALQRKPRTKFKEKLHGFFHDFFEV